MKCRLNNRVSVRINFAERQNYCWPAPSVSTFLLLLIRDVDQKCLSAHVCVRLAGAIDRVETNDVLQQPCTRAFARVSMFTESVRDTNMFECAWGGGGGGGVVGRRRMCC